MLARILAVVLLTLSVVSAATAGDFSNLPQHKRTRAGLYYTPAEASAVMTAEGIKTLFLDLRAPEEIAFVGMPTQADANVPYGVLVQPLRFEERARTFAMELNPRFAEGVARRLAEKGLSKNDRVILICRSGDRSARAADLLTAAGYAQVYSVVEGFEGDVARDGDRKGQRAVNGWKNAGLPWSTQLEKAKMPTRD